MQTDQGYRRQLQVAYYLVVVLSVIYCPYALTTSTKHLRPRASVPTPPPPLVPQLVGIVISTNVIKSAPATKFVENVVRSLDFLGAPDAPVVIGMDRTENRERKAIEEEYIRNLESVCARERRPCYVEPSPKNIGLLDNIVNSLDRLGPVDNVLVMQGDMPFISEVPLLKVAEAMKPLGMTYVRFPRWLVGDPIHSFCDEKYVTKDHEGLGFTPARRWSDNTHLVPIDYYRQDVMKKHYHRKTYPEYFMEGANACKGGETYDYGRNGEGPWTAHEDGREHEAKLYKELTMFEMFMQLKNSTSDT